MLIEEFSNLINAKIKEIINNQIKQGKPDQLADKLRYLPFTELGELVDIQLNLELVADKPRSDQRFALKYPCITDAIKKHTVADRLWDILIGDDTIYNFYDCSNNSIYDVLFDLEASLSIKQ